MATITVETGVLIGIASVAVTLGSKWLGGMLKGKSDSIRVEEIVKKNKELADQELKHIKETIDDMKDHIEEIRRYYNTGKSI